MSSNGTKLAKNPFLIGFVLSLVIMAVSYFYLTHQEYFHNLVANSSYSGLAPIFTLFSFLFCANVLIAGKYFSVFFLIGSVIYHFSTRRAKRP
jgi:hypothetical protein